MLRRPIRRAAGSIRPVRKHPQSRFSNPVPNQMTGRLAKPLTVMGYESGRHVMTQILSDSHPSHRAGCQSATRRATGPNWWFAPGSMGICSNSSPLLSFPDWPARGLRSSGGRPFVNCCAETAIAETPECVLLRLRDGSKGGPSSMKCLWSLRRLALTSQTRPSLLAGWEYRDRRPSRETRNPDMRLWPWSFSPAIA